MKVTTLGIDLAKSVFRVHGVDARGTVVLRRQLTTQTAAAVFGEAVTMPDRHGGLRRRSLLGARDRTARPRGEIDEPTFRRAVSQEPEERLQRCDAICEAVGRPSMRFVPVKSAVQQDVQALHRIRFQLIKWRTALANEIRGLLAEYGIVIAKGMAPLRHTLPLILEDPENQLSGFFREMLGEMADPT